MRCQVYIEVRGMDEDGKDTPKITFSFSVPRDISWDELFCEAKQRARKICYDRGIKFVYLQVHSWISVSEEISKTI